MDKKKVKELIQEVISNNVDSLEFGNDKHILGNFLRHCCKCGGTCRVVTCRVLRHGNATAHKEHQCQCLQAS